MHAIILELIHLINTIPDWYNQFNDAITDIINYDLDEFQDVHNLNDWLLWCDALLTWVPIEVVEGDNIDSKMKMFHFVFNQPSLAPLQDELSGWMIRYADVLGSFLDTPESLTEESLQTFYTAPAYRMNEYSPDASGWQTFNQLFARHVKPGWRPIDALCDDTILVSVSDSVFKGWWPITGNSYLNIKGLSWSIEELLHDNPYKDYFKNGLFTHSYLSPTDYHRLHTPLSGKVLFTEIVPGNVYLETFVRDHKLVTRCSKYILDTDDSVGYQFTQARGVIILQTVFGIVAIIPVGMSFVSSVVFTTEPGAILHKGQEFGYFQFGGSDYIILFPSDMRVRFTAQIGNHYDQGRQIGIIS